jgi:hypothetical protein
MLVVTIKISGNIAAERVKTETYSKLVAAR